VNALACPYCSAPLDVAALLSAVTGYDRGTDCAASLCPGCGKAVEFQVRGGALIVGYTYWSGSFHFEGVLDVPARGLKLVRDADGVHYEFGGTRYGVPGSGDGA
jgi:hypothetical protein